jgi:hypothetical protein
VNQTEALAMAARGLGMAKGLCDVPAVAEKRPAIVPALSSIDWSRNHWT